MNEEYTYRELTVGEIIISSGSASNIKTDTDEQLTENGWLACPSHWNNELVPESIKFRRVFLKESNE